MAILQYTDFTSLHLIVLQNANDQALLTDIITYTEKKYLRKLLGDDLYTAFIAGIAEVTPEAKWTQLRDGVTYTYGGESYVFSGLKEMLKYLVEATHNDRKALMRSSIGASVALQELGERSSETFSDTQIPLLNDAIEIWNEAVCFIDRKNSETPNTYENFYGEMLIKKVPGLDIV
jgi:hypothetical protein